MGFDLYGENPKTDTPEPRVDWDNPDPKAKEEYFKWKDGTKGAYFRNNVWWWRPLWEYVVMQNGKTITDEERERGCYNDGYVIKADKAMRIGIKLKHLISQGHTKQWAEDRQKELDEMPKEKCELCHGTGKRNDEIVKGKCNACNGEGKKDPWEKSYPFSVENVAEFAQFCIESGGFSIC